MSAWFVAVVAGTGVALLVVPRHRPRRFPEHAPSAATEVSSSRPWRSRRPLSWHRGASTDATPRDLAICCDLLAVAAASGCTVVGSVTAVASVESGPVAAALRRVADDVSRGERFADAVAELVPLLGSVAQPLVTTLLAASSSGAPVAPSLLRLADAERRRRRRRIEARVRRLPVLLLVPLVSCVLPAFVLLTLVPAGLSATRGIELPSVPPPRSGAADRSFPRTAATPSKVTGAARTDGGPP